MITRAGDAIWILERPGGQRVGAHRVPRQDAAALARLLLDDRREVGRKLVVAIAGIAGRIGLAVASRVVGHGPEPEALERPRPVHDVAPGRGEAVQEHERDALPPALAPQLAGRPGDCKRRRTLAHRPVAVASRASDSAEARCSTSL